MFVTAKRPCHLHGVGAKGEDGHPPRMPRWPRAVPNQHVNKPYQKHKKDLRCNSAPAAAPRIRSYLRSSCSEKDLKSSTPATAPPPGRPTPAKIKLFVSFTFAQKAAASEVIGMRQMPDTGPHEKLTFETCWEASRGSLEH